VRLPSPAAPGGRAVGGEGAFAFGLNLNLNRTLNLNPDCFDPLDDQAIEIKKIKIMSKIKNMSKTEAEAPSP
jgi:hypothetical protein